MSLNTSHATCDQVQNELAVPTGSLDAASLERHLAGCASCSQQALAIRKLDHAWRTSRPAEPGEAVWQQLWSKVEAQAPLAVPAHAWLPSSRSGAVWAFAALAQAAALLIAAWIFFRVPPQTQAPAASTTTVASVAQTTAPLQVEYELDQGQTLFLVLDARGGTVVVKPRFVSTEELVAFDGEGPDPYASAYQMTFVMLNAMEGME